MLKSGAMALIAGQIQKKLSAMFGTDVSIEKLNVSLMGGTVDAQNVVVAGSDPAVPLLTIARLKAEVSIGAALRKEFVVKSVTIERPVLTITRNEAGHLNLPSRLRASDGAADVADGVRATTDATSDKAAKADESTTWKLDAPKVLLVDGAIHYRDASGYHVAVEQLLAEVKQENGGVTLTVLADSVGRRDGQLNVGQLRLLARLDGLTDLAQWRQAPLDATAELGEHVKVKVQAATLQPLDGHVEFSGSLTLAMLAQLLPPMVRVPDALKSRGITGRTEVQGRASYRPTEGLRVQELNLRAADLALAPAAPPE